MPTNLPPPSYDGPVRFSASATIDAPIATVWDVLLDFQSYSQWNDLAHVQTIIDSKTNAPLSDQIPRAGQFVLMEVHLPPTEDRSQRPTARPVEIITAVDHENYRLALQNTKPMLSWLYRLERWQALSTTEDGKTLYETREIIAGLAAWLIRWFLGSSLQKGFEAVGQGLKRRAEELRAQAQAQE